jgi:hypothetical protein
VPLTVRRGTLVELEELEHPARTVPSATSRVNAVRTVALGERFRSGTALRLIYAADP